MGYACPVCGDPQSDGEHLANHLAFTAMLGDADHEDWLDEHAPDWADTDPAELAGRVTDHANEREFPQVFEDTTGDGHGHDHGGQDHGHDHGGQSHGRGHADGHASGTRGHDVAPGEVADPADLFDDAEGDDATPSDVLAEARELTQERRSKADETDSDADKTDSNADGTSEQSPDGLDGREER